MDKGELLWETLRQVLGCVLVISEESVPPPQINLIKTQKKIQLWRMYPREVITYGFSLVVFTGKPTKPLFLLLLGINTVRSRISPVNSVFLNVFCLLPSTCLWICESCPRCFPRRLSLSPTCLYEVHKPFFTIKTHLKISGCHDSYMPKFRYSYLDKCPLKLTSWIRTIN